MGNFSRIAKPLKILPGLKLDHLISSLHPNETDSRQGAGKGSFTSNPSL